MEVKTEFQIMDYCHSNLMIINRAEKKRRSSLVNDSQKIVGSHPVEKNCQGIFDKWPALSKNWENKQVYTDKPWLIRHYEEYISKQTKRLNLLQGRGDGILEIYRNVFDSLIDTFQSYKPLLAKIKQQYEDKISSLETKVGELLPLKSMLVTVAEECNNRIIDLRKEDKNYVEAIKHENSNLYARISSLLEDQDALDHQVKVLKRQLGEQYGEYREEADARKMLVADLNDLKQQHEDIDLIQADHPDENARGDMTILQIALRKAKIDLDSAHGTIHSMMANYTEVVPRRELEDTQQQFHHVQELYQLLYEQNESLRNEHITLIGTYDQVLEERNTYYSQCMDNSGNMTPRPDWDQTASCVPDENWLKLIHEKTSAEILSMLIANLSSQIPKDDFEGLGTSENIPAHLRHSGKIARIHMSTAELNKIVHDFWHYRFNEKVDRRIDEIFSEYMASIYPSNVREACYTFDDLCKTQTASHQIGLMNDILRLKVHESVLHKQVGIWEQLLTIFSQKPAENIESAVRNKLRELLPAVDELLDKIEFSILDSKTKIEDNSVLASVIFTAMKNERVATAGPVERKHLDIIDDNSVKQVILSLNADIEERELSNIVQWIVSTQSSQTTPDYYLNSRLSECYIKKVPLTKGFD